MTIDSASGITPNLTLITQHQTKHMLVFSLLNFLAE
ncbi:MAG: hypothetical protein ACI9UN_002836 [Granulosicoccus sp.]|jgi:hypothetical protein